MKEQITNRIRQAAATRRIYSADYDIHALVMFIQLKPDKLEELSFLIQCRKGKKNVQPNYILLQNIDAVIELNVSKPVLSTIAMSDGYYHMGINSDCEQYTILLCHMAYL